MKKAITQTISFIGTIIFYALINMNCSIIQFKLVPKCQFNIPKNLC